MEEFLCGLVAGIGIGMLIITLSGTRNAEPYEWAWAERKCASNAGVDYINVGAFSVKAYCENGARFESDSDTIKGGHK